jgi:Fungal N-terminal domain of STAND proteins
MGRPYLRLARFPAAAPDFTGRATTTQPRFHHLLLPPNGRLPRVPEAHPSPAGRTQCNLLHFSSTMDPFTVSTACVGLLAAVAQLTGQLTGFVSAVRESVRDLRAVNRELASLSLCLEALRDDSNSMEYPSGLEQNLLAVLENCDVVTKQMVALIQKMSSGSVGRRVQWAAFGRDDMNKLRSSLEAHKSALDICPRFNNPVSCLLLLSVFSMSMGEERQF